MTPALVTVGGLNLDNVVAADGTVALERMGGNAAYSAVGAALWCDAVGLVSRTPEAFPRAGLDTLARHGIATDGVVTVDVVVENADWFFYDAEGTRTGGFHSPPGALAAAGFATPRLSREEVARWQAILRRRGPPGLSFSRFRDAHPISASQVPAHYFRARGVHLAPSRLPVQRALLPLFRGRGMLVTLDPGWQLADLPLAELEPLLAELDAFLPSEVELRALVPGCGMAEALAVLAALGPGIMAVKLGKAGALVWDRAAGGVVAVPPVDTAAVDPTGAGDAFGGGFLAGLAETGDGVLAACFGTASASFVVEQFGADGALPLDRDHGRARRAAIIARLGRSPPSAA